MEYLELLLSALCLIFLIIPGLLFAEVECALFGLFGCESGPITKFAASHSKGGPDALVNCGIAFYVLLAVTFGICFLVWYFISKSSAG